MSAISEKLGEIGYVPLYEVDPVDASWHKKITDGLGLRLPEDYLEFLDKFPRTGIIGSEVTCRGMAASPWAPNAEYTISLLYASCSNEAFDLITRREDPYDGWDFGKELLVIGDDVGGNFYCLDLRSDTLGQIYFWDHEHPEVETGLYLVADSFTEFVSRMHLRSPT